MRTRSRGESLANFGWLVFVLVASAFQFSKGDGVGVHSNITMYAGSERLRRKEGV
jgi:hypothetical protein